MASRYKKFPNDKMYMRQWRKDNPNYHQKFLKQRYCKECNVEIGKGKQRCSECRIIRVRALARANYKYTPEMATKLKKWREDNPDRCKELYQKARQRKLDKLGPKLCHRCNTEIKRIKKYCPPCNLIVQKEQKKISNDKQAGNRKQRYENRDKDAYNAYHREYQKGKKFRAYQNEYQRNNKDKINEYVRNRYQNDSEYRDRVLANGRKSFNKRYHTNPEFRERHLAIRRHRYRTTKKSWYQLRLERIDKLKVYLEENK